MTSNFRRFVHLNSLVTSLVSSTSLGSHALFDRLPSIHSALAAHPVVLGHSKLISRASAAETMVIRSTVVLLLLALFCSPLGPRLCPQIPDSGTCRVGSLTIHCRCRTRCRRRLRHGKGAESRDGKMRHDVFHDGWHDESVMRRCGR